MNSYCRPVRDATRTGGQVEVALPLSFVPRRGPFLARGGVDGFAPHYRSTLFTPTGLEIERESMAQLPSDDEIREAIRELIPKVDLQTTGMKTFVKMLGKHMGTNLRPRKVFVKEALTEAINAMEEENEEEDDTRDDEDDSGEEHVPASKPRKKGGGGLAAKKEISPQLAAFLGKGGEMSRTEIVKELWNYIKENDLQSPNDKRKILLDDRMQQVFGCKEFTMFTMNKYVGAHVHPFKPVDLTTSSTPSTAKKRKRKGSTEKGEKKKRKSGTQPPYRLSDELVAVLGKSVLPRPQVVSGIW